MHRLDYMAHRPQKAKLSRLFMLVPLTLNIGVAVYCLAYGRDAFAALGGLAFGAALLWNLHHAFNHDEFPSMAGQPPLWRRSRSPIGFWATAVFYVILYIACLLVPPLVRYSAP